MGFKTAQFSPVKRFSCQSFYVANFFNILYNNLVLIFSYNLCAWIGVCLCSHENYPLLKISDIRGILYTIAAMEFHIRGAYVLYKCMLHMYIMYILEMKLKIHM
jgi:hypothetical protein